MPSKFIRLLPAVALLFVVWSCDSDTAKQDRIQVELSRIDELAFPRPVLATPGIGLIKWDGPVRFVIVADKPEDRVLAQTVVHEIAAALPDNAQAAVQVEVLTSLDKDPNWFLGKAVIWLSANPYQDLSGPAKPILRSVANELSDVDGVIAHLKETNPPSYTAFAMRRPGIVTGFLIQIDSDLPGPIKVEGLYTLVISALVPSMTLGKSKAADLGLFEQRGNEVILSDFARDYLRIILSGATKPGMTPEEFHAAALDLLIH